MSEIYKALFKLQGLIRGVQKDSKNPHFKSNYASLEQVTDTIRPHMQACGLVWFQFPGRVNDGAIEVTTTIAHAESGESITGTMEVPLGKRDPQGAGSSITYGLRYSLMAVLGLPPTDDDAETAIDRDNSRPEPEQKPKATAPKPANYDAMLKDFRKCTSKEDMARWWKDDEVKAVLSKWPEEWVHALRDAFAAHGRSLQSQDTVEAIKNQFVGATVVNEHVREQSYLEAGE